LILIVFPFSSRFGRRRPMFGSGPFRSGYAPFRSKVVPIAEFCQFVSAMAGIRQQAARSGSGGVLFWQAQPGPMAGGGQGSGPRASEERGRNGRRARDRGPRGQGSGPRASGSGTGGSGGRGGTGGGEAEAEETGPQASGDGFGTADGPEIGAAGSGTGAAGSQELGPRESGTGSRGGGGRGRTGGGGVIRGRRRAGTGSERAGVRDRGRGGQGSGAAGSGIGAAGGGSRVIRGHLLRIPRCGGRGASFKTEVPGSGFAAGTGGKIREYERPGHFIFVFRIGNLEVRQNCINLEVQNIQLKHQRI